MADDRSQNLASEKFIEKFGKLENKKTGEIIRLPDRATQLRRQNAELLTRKKGLSNKARELGCDGYIVTLTCPSRFHPTTSTGGERRENPRYDKRLGEREGMAFLLTQVEALNRWAAKKGIPILGLRAAHPHGDGTPHFHLVCAIHPDDAEAVESWLRARFAKRGVTQMDFRKLVGKNGQDSLEAAMNYASAYLCAAHEPGEEGGEPTAADQYRAWRRAYGIREFAFFEFGTGKRERASVSTWRLMRTKRGGTEAIRAAIESGNWREFERAATEAKAHLIYKSGENGFGEAVPKLAGVRFFDGADEKFISSESDFLPLWTRKLLKKEAGAGVSKKESRESKTNPENPENPENPILMAETSAEPPDPPPRWVKWVN